MGPRVNHRGWIVLESILSDDRLLCVDFFEDPAGGFGFEHLRADPEDAGKWTAIGGFGASRCDTALAVVAEAREVVSWLTLQPQAARSIDAWQEALAE